MCEEGREERFNIIRSECARTQRQLWSPELTKTVLVRFLRISKFIHSGLVDDCSQDVRGPGLDRKGMEKCPKISSARMSAIFKPDRT